MLKNVLFVSSLDIGFSAPALAETSDTPIQQGGPYVGVNVGMGGSTLKYPATAVIHGSSDTTLSGEARQTSSGVLGGAELGYNIEMEGLVLGLQADIAASDVKGETSLSGSASGPIIGTASVGIYLGTVRARVGARVANGRFMPYVAGGFAYGRVKTVVSGTITGGMTGNPPSINLSGGRAFTSDRTGWTVGAGADYALSRNVAFRAEYLYVDLGINTVINDTYSILGTPVDVNLQMKTTANIVRVGMTYRF